MSLRLLKKFFIAIVFLQKKFTINIIYDMTTTKYKVSLFLIIKRQQTFFAIMGFYAFLTIYTTQSSVTNFLCKDPPFLPKIFNVPINIYRIILRDDACLLEGIKYKKQSTSMLKNTYV